MWETGDRVRFQGNQENYTVTANADGTFTVKDNVGDDGTDTLRNVEILEFNDTEVLLAPETGSWSYTEYDPETGREKLVSEDFAEGTSFSDTIVGGDGRSFLRGGDGNDVLIGDSMSSSGVFASGQDMIDGGKGNDYIDGGGQGSGSQPWENENAAEYFDASARKYTWVNDSDNTAGVARLTASEAKAKAKDLDINVEDKYFDQAAADQAFWLLTDKNGDDGLGTDIVTNVDVLRFGDKEIRLKVFKDTENGFYQGTDYDDKIEIEVSENSYTWNTFVEAGKGDDTVIGSVISDTVILGAGDDFVDGGSQYESASKAKEANSEQNSGGSAAITAAMVADAGYFNGTPTDGANGTVTDGANNGTTDTQAFDIATWSPGSNSTVIFANERVVEKASDGSIVERLGNADVYKEDPTGNNGIAVAIAVEGSSKYIVVWDPMENSYVISDLSTAIATETTLIMSSGDFDNFDGDMGAGDMGAGDMGAGDMGYDDGMDHGMSMGGGNTGDIVEYQGEFDRYVVTTVSGDDLATSGLVSAEFLARIQALDSAASSAQYLIADTKITVVQDTVIGKNSTGTDVLINVEKLRFSDGEFNLAVTSEMWGDPTDQMGWGEVNWRGTLGDDRIVDTTYDGDRGFITSDRMDGDAGNDLMISGAGGDRLIGGIGNDIMDGGANGALTDENRWNIDETIDIAEYTGEIDRFELEKITFEGKTLSIKDANGNLAYMMTPKTKGDAKIGQIFGVDDQGNVGTSVLYQVEEGDTFIVVSDTLPESYGGVGTDILINMEKAQFGYDWEGNVEFQVKYETHTWGGGEGQVDARGTIFDDVIDLRAGKASDFAGGFGGFDDFNTGADIWDGDAFFDAIDNQFDDAVGGFDLWNWQPKASETPLEADVSTLVAFYTGDTNVVAGPFDIYQIELPVAGTFTLVAYSRDEMRVVEEVIARDASGGEIALVETGQAAASDYQVFYPDTASDATMPTADAGDIYNDSLATSSEWTRVAENQDISCTDGYVEDRKFEVYKNNSTDELVAAEFGFAFEPVTGGCRSLCVQAD